MTVLPAVKGAIIAVNAALAANPIALVVIAIAGLVAAFVALWNNCEEFRQFWIDLWDSLQAGAQVVIDGIGTAFEQLGEGFSQVGDGIILMFDSIGSTFSGLGDTISGICEDVGGFFSDMGENISGVWDSIVAGIKASVNTAIGFVNTMISGAEGAINFLVDAINTLHWEIPDWVPLLGGKEFGFDVPHASFPRVPELAQGAVIPPNSPFLAVLGDQPSGTNIEAPLSTIKDALLQAMAQSGNTSAAGPHVFNVYIGNEKFGSAVAHANSRNAYISGGY